VAKSKEDQALEKLRARIRRREEQVKRIKDGNAVLLQ